MSPVPGVTSVVGTIPTPTPSSATVTMATTTTFTSSTPNRNATMSSQQQHYSPSRSQHGSGSGNGNGNGNVSMAANKNKHHFNNNNSIKSTNCNSNNNNSNNNNIKGTFQQRNGGINLKGVASMQQMKQQQEQQQQQQQINKNSSNAMKAKANDMQKQTILAKSSFTHANANTPSMSTVNGAATKSVNNKAFSTPVGTSSPPSSSSSSSSSLSSAQTNCSTKSLTTTTTTTTTATSSNATIATETQVVDPLALPAIKCNGVTSTPAAVVTNAQTTINSTINQDGMQIKRECDPQMIVKSEKSSTTTKALAAATVTTTTTTSTASTTTTQKTATIVTPSTTTSSNRKDSTAATPTEAKKSKNAAAAAGSSHTTTDDDASVDNVIVDKPRKVLLSVMNSHIICHLCNGYLIDATTIVECLHSFCHSCLIKHLRMEQYCPRCEMMINTAKPNIKPDTTLQAIVYKLVPGLYERELMRKRAFYKDRPEDAAMATPEQRGEDTEHLIFSPSDYMSLSLEFADTDELVRKNSDYGELLKPRYLQCPAMCTVGHLKKFVYGKFDIDVQRFNIDLMYKVKTIVLLDHYTLMDVAYIYTWKRDAPMRFYFRVKRSLRPIVKVRKPAPVMPVEVKDEVDEEKPAPIIAPKPIDAANTPIPAVVPDAAMTIIPKPVVSTLNVNEPLIKTPVAIKAEEVEVPENASATKTQAPEVSTKPAKVSKTPKSAPIVSSSTDDKQRAQVSSTSAERKAEKAQQNSHSSSPKTSSKEKREAKEALKRANETPREERKVENIKLKIDLSKHNSVTIINMSDPHRREITKPVRPEKEWKLKSKRDKDSSPKHLLSSERKSKTPSPLTVPPLTIKAEQISPQTKISPLAKSSPRVVEKSPEPAVSAEDEEQKSQFLMSFALTPIKSLKAESPNKSPKSPKRSPNTIQTHKILVKSPTSAAREPLKTTISAVYKTSALPAKRKIKELSKQTSKKPRLSPPLPVEDFKIKLPPASPSPHNATKSNAAAPVTKQNAVISSDKPLMPPTRSTNADTTTTTTNNAAAMRPPIGLPPKKPAGKLGTLAPKANPMAPPPLPFQRIEMAAPGNRTPIAKRYQPILPKSTRPNPFANIPSEVNKLLKDAGTEIKTIASNSKATGKVYGPKTPSTNATTITPEHNVMGPPASPIKTPTQSVQQTRVGGAGNANKSNAKNAKSSSANNYLNLALFNASKTKGNEVPPGCRTPMYTPNSPIYSPSSPQYMPNYNIPTVPTYKYTPRPSSGGGSFLQSILGGANNQMAGLFPAPPTKKDSAANANVNSTTGRSSPSHGGGQQKSYETNQAQAPKRVYPFARSPSPEDPPEKQLKVKSLLTSCNINIPSSLSITITREDSESQTNNASYPKHKSPVNNYIEILKLPDQSCEVAEQNKRASPPAPQKQTATQSQSSSSALKLLMPPTAHSAAADSTARRNSTDTATYGGAHASQMQQKSQNSMAAPKAPYNAAAHSQHKQTSAPQNTATKSPQAHTVSKSASHDNSALMPNTKFAEPPQKSPQPRNSAEKRSPMHSPEKNINLSPNSKSAQRSPNSDGSKKFRPILPRQNPATAIAEVVPPKVTTANIIGTYSSPSGVAVKIHANKKVTPPKKSPSAQQTSQPQPQLAHQQPKNGLSPQALSATKGSNASQAQKSPAPAHQSSSKLPTNTKTNSTPPPPPPSASSAATNSNANANSNNKMSHSSHPGMPTTALPPLPNLPAMQNLPPTPLQMAAMAAGLQGMPPHLSGVSAADFSKLLKDNLLRAQVQAAAAASQPGGMFYPYANPQQLSHHYSYQQAFMLEQLSRFQRAEALNEFMQKLKNGSAEKLALESMAASVGGGAKAGTVAASKVSPGGVSSSGGASSKSNSGKSNASSNASPSNNNSSAGNSATKAK